MKLQTKLRGEAIKQLFYPMILQLSKKFRKKNHKFKRITDLEIQEHTSNTPEISTLIDEF